MKILSEIDPTISKVDEKSMDAIKILYENCKLTSKGFLTDETATLSVDKWFDCIIPTILENVQYVSKSPNFTHFEFCDGEMKMCNETISETRDFKTIEELVSFLKSDKFYEMVLLYVICFIDLEKMEKMWMIRFGKIENKEIKRDRKIKYLEDGINNN